MPPDKDNPWLQDLAAIEQDEDDLSLLLRNLEDMATGHSDHLPHTVRLTARLALDRINALGKQLFALREENRLLRERGKGKEEE